MDHNMPNNSTKGVPLSGDGKTRANSCTEEEDNRISDRIMESQNFTAYNDTSAMPSHLYGEPGFAAFFATLFVIIFATGILLVQTAVYVFLSTAIPTVIRWLILNQLAACAVFLVAPGFVMSAATVLGASRLGTPLPPSPLAFCQFLSWLLSIGATGRSWSLAVFSLFVIVTTIRGLKAVKRVHVLASLIAVWILTFLLNVHIIIPYPQYGVYGVQNIGGVFCYPSNRGVSQAIRTATLVLWVVLGAGLPTVITITIPIITLCYIRRNTITAASAYNKRIAKFALFLLTGNIVNIISRTVPVILSFVFPHIAGIIISNICISVSDLPTLIITLVYFKPVREKLKRTVTCGCLRNTKGRKEDSGELDPCERNEKDANSEPTSSSE